MAKNEAAADAPKLRRTVGLGQMTLYGLGSMLGSGIYGLIGRAAGESGNAVWLAFLVALVAALLTALSYASLSSRHPRAAGAAYVTERAFGKPILSFTVGMALVFSGLTSVATQSRVFSANFAALLGWEQVPPSFIAVGFALVLAGIVFRGVRESMWVNVVCTLVEAGGLLIVIAAGMSYWGSVDYFSGPANTDQGLFLLLVQAAVLTFFSFIGFEDTINLAEETKNPERNVPLGLILAMGIAAVLYIGVAITAVSVVPVDVLAHAPSPLSEVMSRAAPAFPSIVLTLITLFAVANTALVNYVTASRLIYGMSQQNLLPVHLSKVHAKTHTPHVAVLVLFLVVAPLAFFGSIEQLAAATVLLLLGVFMVMNGAAFVLKRRKGEAHGLFEIPAIIPILGALSCFILVAVRVTTGDIRGPLLAGGLLLAVLAFYAVTQKRH